GGARRGRRPRRGRPARDTGEAECAARRCQRPRRGWRSNRWWGGGGARGGRRDAESRRTAAGAGPTGYACHCGEHATTNWWSIRDGGSWAAERRRSRRAEASVARRWRKRCVEPLRGTALGGDPAGRARRRTRPAPTALARGKIRRGAGCAGLGGARDRQIAPDRGAIAGHPERSAYEVALFLLAVLSEHCALFVHHPARTRCRIHARGHSRREARQATGIARARWPWR